MKKVVMIFLALISLSAYSKQIEKLTFKQIHEWTFNQEIVFICKIEASTGYAYRDGKWQVTQFETGEKFLLRELTKDDPGFQDKNQTPFAVFDVGEKVPRMFCAVNEDAGSISCKGLGELSFSIETTQFLRIEPEGAVYPDDFIKESNPKLKHGSCLLKRDMHL